MKKAGSDGSGCYLMKLAFALPLRTPSSIHAEEAGKKQGIMFLCRHGTISARPEYKARETRPISLFGGHATKHAGNGTIMFMPLRLRGKVRGNLLSSLPQQIG